MGTTLASYDEIRDVLILWHDEFRGKDYDLAKKNCRTFVNQVLSASRRQRRFRRSRCRFRSIELIDQRNIFLGEGGRSEIRARVDVGYDDSTRATDDQIRDLLIIWGQEFRGIDYNLGKKNCQHFVIRVLQEVGENDAFNIQKVAFEASNGRKRVVFSPREEDPQYEHETEAPRIVTREIVIIFDRFPQFELVSRRRTFGVTNVNNALGDREIAFKASNLTNSGLYFSPTDEDPKLTLETNDENGRRYSRLPDHLGPGVLRNRLQFGSKKLSIVRQSGLSGYERREEERQHATSRLHNTTCQMARTS